MSPTLRIATHDGAEVRADGRGFAARDRAEARESRVAATLQFRSDDARYAWADRALSRSVQRGAQEPLAKHLLRRRFRCTRTHGDLQLF
jgi:hypothetical protein